MTPSDFSANLHGIIRPVVTPDFHGDSVFLLGSTSKALPTGAHGYGPGLDSVDPDQHAVLYDARREDWQELGPTRAIPATEGLLFHA